MRRIGFGVGLALMVLGWGATQFADLQQRQFPDAARLRGWVRNYSSTSSENSVAKYTAFGVPSAAMCASGWVIMAAGASVVGLSIPETQRRNASAGGK